MRRAYDVAPHALGGGARILPQEDLVYWIPVNPDVTWLCND